tara:strand:+ start:397 stop:723 length:327 start_codon:yes stop_codon:yes gene_type:complete
MKRIFIVDKTTARHIQWNILKNKLKQYKLDYKATLNSTELEYLNCDILLLHANNDDECNYIYSNIDNLKYTVVFFSGLIERAHNIDGNLYLNDDDVEDFLKYPDNYKI